MLIRILVRFLHVGSFGRYDCTKHRDFLVKDSAKNRVQKWITKLHNC
jgi:hypothetical protein